MKVEKLSTPPSLWRWLQATMPRDRFVLHAPTHGYGELYLIYALADAPNLAQRFLGYAGFPVAHINGLVCTLYQPQYLQDLQNFLEEFERATGIEPTLRYWEGA